MYMDLLLKDLLVMFFFIQSITLGDDFIVDFHFFILNTK